MQNPFSITATIFAASLLPAPAATAAPLYAFTARHTWTGSDAGCPGAEEEPPDAALVRTVRERIREGYETGLRRMFQPLPPDGTADLAIATSPPCARIVNTTGGQVATVDTRSTISAGDGTLIAEVVAHGEELLVGPEWIPIALDRATSDCIANLPTAFADSPAVVQWLTSRSVEPVGSSISWPPRGSWVAFGDVGFGMMAGAADGEPGTGLLAHAGFSGPWFLVQGIVATWSSSFGAGSSRTGNASFDAVDLGIEAGPVLRIGPAIELRAGGGVHHVSGEGEMAFNTASSSYSVTVPSAFVAAQTSIIPSRTGIRLRLGLEVRKYFDATVAMPELSRTIAVADVHLGAFLGIELPTSGVTR